MGKNTLHRFLKYWFYNEWEKLVPFIIIIILFILHFLTLTDESALILSHSK